MAPRRHQWALKLLHVRAEAHRVLVDSGDVNILANASVEHIAAFAVVDQIFHLCLNPCPEAAAPVACERSSENIEPSLPGQ